LIEAVKHEYPFSDAIEADLKEYQEYLKLRDSDIAEVHNRVLPTQQAPSENLPFSLVSFAVVKVDAEGRETNRQQHQAQVFTEDLGNGVTLEMVKIPGGTFLMGQTEAEKTELIRQFGEDNYQLWFDIELPQHQVTISSFLMGKYPITQAQYQRIMGINPSRFQGLNRPIECVSWKNALDFCQKLSRETLREYRLPTN
jgi:eukaryotic-like serine/threonine-protein kinase